MVRLCKLFKLKFKNIIQQDFYVQLNKLWKCQKILLSLNKYITKRKKSSVNKLIHSTTKLIV